ncbi:MAG: hypothetical protein AB7I42_29035 [Bradyrhizobium sp.]|uniref:hypothetical protein n=1 Tax=Bradyrhizobium sp. TaxID=376 RepID=UPI003D11E9C1
MSDTRPIALLPAVMALRDTLRTLRRMLAALAGFLVLAIVGIAASCAVQPVEVTAISELAALVFVSGVAAWLVVRRVR